MSQAEPGPETASSQQITAARTHPIAVPCVSAFMDERIGSLPA
jgi:hypothetical protein